VPQTREALERAQLEDLVEQEGTWLAARATRVIEERQQRIERFARGCRSTLGGTPRKRCRRDDGLQKALRCGGAAFDVDVLRGTASDAVPHALQKPRPPAPASAKDDRDSRRSCFQRASDAPLEPRLCARHSYFPRRGPCAGAALVVNGPLASV
jgi:hypothetical protein